MIPPALSGKRVLVVDDELLVAMLIEDMLADAGCVVIGPFARVQPALAAAETEAIDIAVMDVNVAGQLIFPVAEMLESRGVPFLFITGYGQATLPKDRPHWEAHAKPFMAIPLLTRLAAKLAR